MTTMVTIKRIQTFRDREYRHAYAESFLDTFIATQIRVLREQRGWTQNKLADEAGMKQSRISAIEDASYSGWSVSTLKRLARAFDVPPTVNFGSFGRLLSEIDDFDRAALERPEFAADPLVDQRKVILKSQTGMDTTHTTDTGYAKNNLLPFSRERVQTAKTPDVVMDSSGSPGFQYTTWEKKHG